MIQIATGRNQYLGGQWSCRLWIRMPVDRWRRRRKDEGNGNQEHYQHSDAEIETE